MSDDMEFGCVPGSHLCGTGYKTNEDLCPGQSNPNSLRHLGEN